MSKKPFRDIGVIGHIDHHKTILSSAITMVLAGQHLKHKPIEFTKIGSFESVDNKDSKRGILVPECPLLRKQIGSPLNNQKSLKD